jgi:L-threonylcarbamoyladenylate synthase
MIGKAAIEGVAGPVEAAVAAANQAPGLHPVHYQPRTPLKLIRRGQHEPGRGIVIAYSWAADLTLPSDPAGYAAALYERLHRADAQGFEWIGIEPPPETEEWEAVWDRLRRAVTR